MTNEKPKKTRRRPSPEISLDASVDYATCRQPVRGKGHCNALVTIGQPCVACFLRTAKGTT